MTDIFATDNELINIAEVTGKIDKKTAKTFQPWHKPRKQFIRENQWFKTLERIASDNKYKEIQTIKYFGLPGGDLLDVTYISNSLLENVKLKQKQLLVHGFINSESEYRKAEVGISKLLDSSNISKDSKVERFSFEDLHSDSSEAWNRVKGIGNYHFINLDFCDCILKEKTLKSIYRLLDYQAKRIHGFPWLLCITTRLNKSGIAQDILEKFNVVLETVQKDPELINVITDSFAEAISVIDQLIALSKVDEKKVILNELLQISLVCWLVNEAIKSGCKIELKSSYKYSVDLFNKEVDMHSFVFYLEKKDVVMPDLLGLIEPNNQNTLIDDASALEMRKKSMKKLGDSLNLDDYLDSDQVLLNSLADRIMQILEKCGYNISTYKQEMNKEYGYSLK